MTTNGHEVFSVYESAPGMHDDDIVRKAFDENWILITNDKDFGERVYRERKPHHVIILLRLTDERAISKIEILQRLLNSYAENLPEQFAVVTEKSIHFAKQ